MTQTQLDPYIVQTFGQSRVFYIRKLSKSGRAITRQMSADAVMMDLGSIHRYRDTAMQFEELLRKQTSSPEWLAQVMAYTLLVSLNDPYRFPI